jgi:hypothetical protein
MQRFGWTTPCWQHEDLDGEALKLFEERALGVGLVVDLPPPRRAAKNPGLGKPLDLARHAA